MLVVIIILALMLLGLFGFLVLPIVLKSQSWAKKSAKAMLRAGTITNPKTFEQVSRVLATMPNDLEAADLWHKLQELRQVVK